MAKKVLTAEEKKLDMDIGLIAVITFGVFLCYAMMGSQMTAFVKNSTIAVAPRLLLNAGVQFGIAGLGTTVVCILRRERFAQFGLKRDKTLCAIAGTGLCFLPYIAYVFLSGQFEGWRPLRILITEDVLAAGFPAAIAGMALIAVVWGFFEGFNYAVICEKISRRYPSRYAWLDYGAVSCAIVCLLFHPLSTSFWGIVEMVTTCAAIYGMLMVRKKTGNAWGCVFAFCLIWNAL